MSGVYRFGEGSGRRTLLVDRHGSVKQLRKGEQTFSKDAETWASLSDWATSNVGDFLDTLPSSFGDDAKTLVAQLLRAGYAEMFDFPYSMRKSRPFGGLDESPLFLRSDGKLLYNKTVGNSFSSLNIDSTVLFCTSRKAQVLYIDKPNNTRVSDYFKSNSDFTLDPSTNMTFVTSSTTTDVPPEYNNLSKYFSTNEFVSGLSGPSGLSGSTGPRGPTGPCNCLKREDIVKIVYETLNNEEPVFSHITSGSNIYSSDKTYKRGRMYWGESTKNVVSPIHYWDISGRNVSSLAHYWDISGRNVSSLAHYWDISGRNVPSLAHYWDTTPVETNIFVPPPTTMYLPNAPFDSTVTKPHSMSSSDIPGYDEPIITSDGVLIQKKGEPYNTTVIKVTDKPSSCCNIA
jgi:hypothetical protein